MNDTAPVRPRIDCPTWCQNQPVHTDDYETWSSGCMIRYHSTTLTTHGTITVEAVAQEVADPDGANALIEPPVLVVFGIEQGDALTTEEARGFAQALIEAADLLQNLESETP